MNSEIKIKWINALRSSEYKQDKGRLKTHDGFCCLGVLCDVIDKNIWRHIDDDYYYRGEVSSLSDQMLGELKLTIFQMNALVLMNDSLGKDFNQIADYIEKEL